MFVSKALALVALAATAFADTVSFDRGYDDASRSLTAVACSDGPHGLMRKGWTKQGDIPRFPYIGGAVAVAGYDSPQCGTCWNLQYDGRSINVLAIDHAGAGFNIAFEAMNDLTGGFAEHYGRVDAKATQVDSSACGV